MLGLPVIESVSKAGLFDMHSKHMAQHQKHACSKSSSLPAMSDFRRTQLGCARAQLLENRLPAAEP